MTKQKGEDNPLDHPWKFAPCKCAVCERCQRHKAEGWCIYGGPYSGYSG